MSTSTSAPEPHGLIPLTVFDKVFERTTFVTGWLVEGTIDTNALESALRRLTEKWRLLAGRVQSSKENNETKWFIRVPLGPLPPDYATYALTTSTSDVPLSTYVPSIPIPRLSTSLPPAIFIHPATPRQYTAWENSNHPLTCWHLTHFPATSNEVKPYTAIGFARSHGIFDGLGAALITKALVAEMKGGNWSIPSLPSEGVNTNPLLDILENEVSRNQELGKAPLDYKGYSILGAFGFLKLIAWHLWEKWWKGADRRVVLLPKDALAHLVESVKSSFQDDDRASEQVTSGDILAAWIYKTIYSSGVYPNASVHCTNVAAIRTVLTEGLSSSSSDALKAYAHNAFMPIPYPLFKASDLQSSSLAHVSRVFAKSRLSLSKDHVVAAYTTLKIPTIVFPSHPEANDDLVISNVSASRILETDWTLVGGKRTICGYRYQLTPTELLFTNAVYIAGRLDCGTVVLDVSLNKAKLALFVKEVERLVSNSASSSI